MRVLPNILPGIDAKLQRYTADREIVCDVRGPDGEQIRGKKQTGKRFDEF